MQQLTLSIIPPSGKTEAKATVKALDIVVDADLKLKHGVHYGLLGRNGSGKSSMFGCNIPSRRCTYLNQALLQAIASKIIPGIRYSIRIALLQQTATNDGAASVLTAGNESLKKTALQFIRDNDTARNELQAELDGK